MKKVLIAIGCLFSLCSRAQTIQYLGGTTTQIYVRGQLRIDTVVYLPLRDTTFTPSQVGAMVVKSSNGGLYLWNGTKWNTIPVGSTAWGGIKGSIASQTDLITLLNGYQPLLTPGYGIKIASNTISFDTANARKVDTVFRTNDSTLTYKINGHSYNVLIRGTAAGGINSLTLTLPGSLFVSPITWTNTGGAWSATAVPQSQLANTFFAGPTTGAAAAPSMRTLVLADLPANIPNSTLANSNISLALGVAGTTPAWGASSVALGGTATLNIPFASSTTSGILSNTDWTNFNNAVNPPVTSVNGQLGAVTTLSADSIKKLPIDTSSRRNGYALTFDSVNHKWVLAPGSTTSGTVTSVAMTVPAIFSVSGSPITGAGTLAIGSVNQSANTVYAGPASGSSAAAGFRAIVNADFPTSGVTPGTYNSLTVNAQGIATAGSIVGTGITSLNALTGSTQTFATGTSGSNFNISSVGTTHTFNIPDASATNRGALTTADWSSFNAKQAAGNYITALTGDVAASGPGSSTATIQANTVTYAKIQAAAAAGLMGATAGGNFGLITLGTNLSFSGSTLNVTGSGSIARNAQSDSLVVGSTAVLDKDDPSNSPYYRLDNAKRLLSGFSTARQGKKSISIFGIGDSQFDNIQGFVQPFQQQLGNKFTWSGPGYQSMRFVNVNNISAPNYVTANWNLTTPGAGLDEYDLESTNTSTDLSFSQNSSSLSYNTWTTMKVLWWGQTGGGTFTVSVDGGAATTINTSSATGAQTTTITGLTNATHSFVIHQSTFNSSGCIILGFVLTNGNNGIIVNRAGHLGTYTTDFLSLDSASSVAQLAAIAPDVVYIAYTNDYIGNVTDTNTYRANMQHIYNRVKAASPNCAVIFQSPYDVNPLYHAGTLNLRSYESQLRQLAIVDTATAFITTRATGYWPAPYNDSLTQDTITHMNISGGSVIVSQYLALIGQVTVDRGLLFTLQQTIDNESLHHARLPFSDTLDMAGSALVIDSVADFYVKNTVSGTSRGLDVHETGSGTQLLGVNRGGSDGFTISNYNNLSFGSYIGMNANGSINHGNLTLTALGTPARIIFNNFLGGNSHFAQIYGYGADNNIEYVFAGLNGFNLAGNDGARQGSYLKFTAQTSGLAMQGWVNNANTGADIFGFGASRLGHFILGGSGTDNNLGNVQINESVWANKDSLAVSVATSAVPVYQDSTTGKLVRVYGGLVKYPHTIFAPTTGGTVALVNGQYNIINPAGALLALTVNLPSSPANNDVVYIKYTQAITTVTYGNGTVVDGITAPTAGGLVTLTYDSGTTSWY